MQAVNTEMVSTIRDGSRKRVAASSDFQKIEKDIEKYLARKQRKTVSLNEEDLRKERVEEEQKTRDKAEASGDEFADFEAGRHDHHGGGRTDKQQAQSAD